ncbi:radical SAM/SPASM domain-containing protein [Apibacter sp. HY039]|uniref:radical SAM/SPASM domain-containing protein n=1 Tax=Apibacter sp. HY039 TaxID=2501476 RepID=UPI000FEBB82B|nr:radical SAM protein [Apibacter sp. HY039]
MKLSKYNIFFFHEENYVGYNSLQGEFIMLVPELYELFKAAENECNWRELEQIHVEFYNHLVEKGFLVPIDFNELEEVKRISRQTDFENDELFELTVNPTMNCNFKCWYCYETHIKKSRMSEETLITVSKLIDNILTEKTKLKEFNLSWFGGEPLLYFNNVIKPLLEINYPKVKNKGIKFSSGFTTNGLLLNQEIVDVCKKYNANYFQITLDGHRERHNQVRFISKQRGSYDEILANIFLCLKNKSEVSVRLNISEETFEKLPNIIEDFSILTEEDRKYLSFSFHEVWQVEEDINGEVQEVVALFREAGFNTLYRGAYSDAIRESCYADKKNHALINYNGEVFKCTARDFESKSREGILTEEGKINWNEIYDKRMHAKFKNKPCLECVILPMCNGGCSQHAMEREGKDYCVMGYDENKKLEIVKDKFLYLVS